MAGKYLDWYAADLAWREDHRRVDFRKQARLVLASALAHPVSRNLKGYWQRPGKAREALAGWDPLSGRGGAAGAGAPARVDAFAGLPYLPFPGGRALRVPLTVLGSWYYRALDRVG